MDQINPVASAGTLSRFPKKWIALGIVVLLIVLAVAAWWITWSKEVSQEIAPGQTLVTAEPGTVVRKFPQELILEENPTVQKSYRIEYSQDNVTQPFARYISAKNFADNVQLFRDYFTTHEWEMFREGKVSEAPITFFHGRKGDASANVVIREREGKVEVSIAYALER